MKTVEIQSQRRVFDGFFKIDEVEFCHQRRDGSMSPPLRRLHLNRGDGVTAVLHNPARQTLLFVRQFRFSTYENGPGWLLETVAGVVESGQTPEECVILEIREETGYRVRDLELELSRTVGTQAVGGRERAARLMKAPLEPLGPSRGVCLGEARPTRRHDLAPVAELCALFATNIIGRP